MPQTSLPPAIVLPSEQRLRDIESAQMFGRRTIWSAYALAGLVGGALFLRSQFHQTALLAPIDPSFHAAMIGGGVFIGVLFAAVEYDGWRLGIGRVHGGIPTGISALLCMIMMVGLCGVGGSYAAEQLVELHAFHGLSPQGRDAMFIVIGRSSSRSGDWLDLRAASSGGQVSIACSAAMYSALAVGDRIVLPVQTGRNGVQRVTLPPLRNLRRG